MRTLPPLLLFGLFFVSVSVVELLGTLSVMVDAAIVELLGTLSVMVDAAIVELLGTLSVMVDVALMVAIIDFLTETGKGYVVNHTL